MKTHLTDGDLRAALDGELGSEQLQHLAGCTECLARQQEMQVKQLHTARLLGFLAPQDQLPGPSPQRAWVRLNKKMIEEKEISMTKRWFTFPTVRFAAVALTLLTLVMVFPGSRAWAGEFLNLFRVQQVQVVSVDFTGMEQLTGDGTLGNRFTEMIGDSVNMQQEPSEPVVAANAEEASELAGFEVRIPEGMTPSQINVTSGAAFTFTVDRAKSQALLNEAGRGDLVLPESVDGAEILVNIPSAVSIGFGTCPKPGSEVSGNTEQSTIENLYPECVIFAQIPSPIVNAPADLDIEALAQIGLEFTGMSTEEAQAFTSTVDWTSTLIVPIPQNASVNEQVAVDGVTGTLIQRPSGEGPQFALLWAKDGIIYAISGLGSNTEQAINMANSLP